MNGWIDELINGWMCVWVLGGKVDVWNMWVDGWMDGRGE